MHRRLTVPPLFSAMFGACAGVVAAALHCSSTPPATAHWAHGGLPVGGKTAQLGSWAAAVRRGPLCQPPGGQAAPDGRPTAAAVRVTLRWRVRATALTIHTVALEAVWAARLARYAGQPAAAGGAHSWTRIIAMCLGYTATVMCT
jgi:hypothetical protein